MIYLGDTGDDEGKKSLSREQELVASLDTKAKFAKQLYRLSGMEIGHVISVLDIRCPQALELPDPSADLITNNCAGVSDVEINVDAIDARTLAELERYVKEKTKTRSNSIAESLDDQGSAKKKQRRST